VTEPCVVRCSAADCIALAVRLMAVNDGGGTSRQVPVCATHDPRQPIHRLCDELEQDVTT
jgi:hypothetical protein